MNDTVKDLNNYLPKTNKEIPMPDVKAPYCPDQDDCPLQCEQCGKKFSEMPTLQEAPAGMQAPVKPYCCPICTGKGIVAGGFYNSLGETLTSSCGQEPCRACNGTGIIWG
jgi:hypothetical protein